MMTYSYCGEIVGRPLETSCKILVARAKFSVALATRRAQFRTLAREPFTADEDDHTLMNARVL